MAGYQRRGWQGALSGLGTGIANTGNAYLDHIFKGEDLAQEDSLLRGRQQAALVPKMGELMLGHPEMADALEKWGSSQGLDLSAFHAPDSALTAPLAAGIAGAKTEADVPGLDQIIGSLKGLGRPSLTAPSYGPMGQATQGAPPDIAADVLPSTSYGPTQNPTIQSLMAARQARLDALKAQRGIGVQNAGDIAQAQAHGQGVGATAPDVVAGDVFKQGALEPGAVRQAGETTGAQFDAAHTPGRIAAGAREAGANAGATTRAGLAPDIMEAEADKAGRIKSADLNAEYNSIVTPQILDFKQREADIANKGKIGAERQKDIEDAKVAGVNLARQVNQLKPMYDKAMKGDATAAKLYHDLVEQAAVNAGRASGYKGQFREYEYQAARGLFPSLLADQALGTAPAKWKALNDLIRTAPTVLQNVSPGAGIDEYIKAVQAATGGDDPLTDAFNARKPGG